MATFSDMTQGGAKSVTKQSLAPQTVADAATTAGATLDRVALGNPDSCEVVTNVSYTGAGGAGGAAETIKVDLYHGAASNMSDETLFATYSQVVPWTQNGAVTAISTLPVNIIGAKQYIRAKVTTTKSGTITVTLQTVAQCLKLFGTLTTPDVSYASNGYSASAGN